MAFEDESRVVMFEGNFQEYEEDKNKPKEKPEDKSEKTDAAASDAAALADAEPPSEGEAAPPEAAMGMGMMAGMYGHGHKGEQPPKAEVKYEPSVWGRYAKVLLSSTEFVFIN